MLSRYCLSCRAQSPELRAHPAVLHRSCIAHSSRHRRFLACWALSALMGRSLDASRARCDLEAMHDPSVFEVGCICETCRAVRVRGGGHPSGLPADMVLQRPPLGPPLRHRDLRCCTCRRFFCTVLAPAEATIVVCCPGCEAEGR